MRSLSLGCGFLKHDGAVTIDIRPEAKPDILHDLEKIPWPLRSIDFDVVYAIDILEHLYDVFPAMDEIHRVLKPGGILHIRTDYYKSENAFTDPTHRHYFTESSFDYCDPETFLGSKYPHYTKGKWKIKSKALDGQDQVFEMERL